MNLSHPWLNDDTPTAHRVARVVLFLTSFSWTLNPVQDYMAESTPVEKIFTRMIPLFFVLIYCFVSPHRQKIKSMFRLGLFPMFWYILIGIVSGIGSVQPALCAWKGLEILICLIWVSISCHDTDSTGREFTAFTKYTEILLWVTIVLAVINPALGLRRSPSIVPWIQGFLAILNPNAIGFMSVLVIIRLLFLPAKNKALRLLIISGTLICAQSRTSYAVTMLVILFYVLESFRKKQIVQVFISSVFVLFALGLSLGWMDIILSIFMRGQTTTEMSTLSGRTDYWSFALKHVHSLGGGLATGSRSLIFMGWDAFQKQTVNMHNSYIEALMGAGYVGAIPFLFMLALNILRQIIKSFRVPSIKESIFAACAIMFAARGMTSVVLALFSFDFLMMMIFWAWVWTSSRPVPKAAQERPRPRVFETTLAEAEALSRG